MIKKTYVRRDPEQLARARRVQRDYVERFESTPTGDGERQEESKYTQVKKSKVPAEPSATEKSWDFVKTLGGIIGILSVIAVPIIYIMNLENKLENTSSLVKENKDSVDNNSSKINKIFQDVAVSKNEILHINKDIHELKSSLKNLSEGINKSDSSIKEDKN